MFGPSIDTSVTTWTLEHMVDLSASFATVSVCIRCVVVLSVRWLLCIRTNMLSFRNLGKDQEGKNTRKRGEGLLAVRMLEQEEEQQRQKS